MQYRTFGKAGWQVSEIGFGAWAIGGSWGEVSDKDALDALRTGLDQGMNFIDTADVYGDGRSERLVGQILKERRSERIYVATKAGRRLDPHVPEGFTRENLMAFIERSLGNLGVDTLDVVQLHCPPTPVYYMPEVFGILDDVVKAGKLRYYAVSVEKVEEAIKALEFPIISVQIIFNMFRQRPADMFFDLARQRNVAILARVPLASGLLTGKMTRQTTFAPDDHRQFNRHGESFDVGETFAGVDYETGLQAVEELRPLVPAGLGMAQFALRWILMFDAVTLAIPGAKNPRQAMDNASAADFAGIDASTMAKIKDIYDRLIKPQVHQRW
jgi:aryl-alcohol dehydrogenase-like predicted oxidoreductase